MKHNIGKARCIEYELDIFKICNVKTHLILIYV